MFAETAGSIFYANFFDLHVCVFKLIPNLAHLISLRHAGLDPASSKVTKWIEAGFRVKTGMTSSNRYHFVNLGAVYFAGINKERITMDIWIVSAILVVALYLLISEKITADLTAIGVIVALMVCRVLSPLEAVAGFAHPACASMVESVTQKHGAPQEIASEMGRDRILYWQDGSDFFLIHITKDIHDQIRYEFMIYFVANMEDLLKTELNAGQRSQKERKDAGRQVF